MPLALFDLVLQTDCKKKRKEKKVHKNRVGNGEQKYTTVLEKIR